MKKTSLWVPALPLLLVVACVGTSKSSNPLTPTVAGPIAGVGISAPTILSPGIDARINTTTQPISLRVGNAVTTGVRPLSYRFEIATDPGFTNKVFTKDGVPHDASGSTSVTLSSALASDRKYFWHARAEDGANTGDFSATSAFNIFTPVIFGAPIPLAPINGATTTSSQPQFLISNANYTGPVGQVAYYMEISTSSSFSDVILSYQFFQTPSETALTVPTSLAAGMYFWRVRAYYSEYTGPFSSVQSFRSPGITTGGGGSVAPGQPCGPPYPTTPLGILECRRSQYPLHMAPGEHVAFLSGVAQDFNAAGVPGGPFGILVKTSGNNCNGYSCDIICAGNGSGQQQWDVLIDETYVTWAGPISNPTVRECQIQ